ncbi:histidine kinase CKI1-like [Bidens hawaiensis]|uniref:histidine kinase CKI1-like n=1 Tax=Bidens hawaiensis TaxID=980011 RepID=UPI004049AD45
MDLRIVESSTEYLQGLLNSILDTNKIEAGKMDLDEKPFDLVKALENVVDMFYPVGLKKQVDVILDLQHDMLTKYSQVNGDERRLKQILTNLLSNAVKFTSEGHVTVGVRARAVNSTTQSPVTGSGGVNDTGIGIAKEKRDSIFENYVQVRLMGGEISIVGKEPDENGTCFRFNVIFKVSRSDPHAISEDEKTNTSSGSNTPFCSPIRKESNSSTVVLFISSDERRKVSQKFLRAHGLKVLATKTFSSIGYLTRPGRSPRPNRSPRPSRSPKDVPLSALDGTDVSLAQMNNRATLPGFILLVVDTTWVNFWELCKVVAKFKKDSKDECIRVVWLGLRCMQAHGLNENQLPPMDVVLPMPLHGSRLYSLIDMVPEFGDRMARTPPHANRHEPERQVEVQDIIRISPNKSPLKVFDTCTNGQEALTFVSKGLTDQRDIGASHILPYDYILMDCQMPVMDGCEATRQIRLMEKDYGVHIPVIGLTAHEEGEELNKFLKEIDIHVSKPLNEHKLLKVIEDLHSIN